MESTKFGFVVSGKIPEDLMDNVSEVQIRVNSPVFQYGRVRTTSCHFIGYQNIINPGMGCLEDELRSLWEKEHSIGVLGNETHTDDDRATEIIREGVYFDKVLKQYVTPLPFNGKEEFLKTNESSARARTRNQQILMLKNSDYMKSGVDAFQKMIDMNAVEKINGDEESVVLVLFTLEVGSES